MTSLIPALLQTLPDAPLLVPLLPPLIRATLLLGLTANSAPVVEKAFQTIALCFRDLAKEMVNDPVACWGYVREGLGARIPEIEAEETEVELEIAEVEEDLQLTEEATMQIDDPIEDDLIEPTDDDPFASTSAVEAIKTPVQPLTFGRSAILKLRTQPHLRLLLASSFAYLIRRCSIEQLTTLIQCINATPFTPQLNESISWIIMESCQGIDTRLHSRASTIFATFARELQDAKIVERAEIAIIHHTRVEHADSFVGAILDLAKEGKLRLLSVLMGVRKGNRVNDVRQGEVLALLDGLKVDENRQDVVGLCVKVFITAKLQGLLSVGKRVVERMRASDHVSVRSFDGSFDGSEANLMIQGYESITTLALALSDLQWPLWADFLATPLLQVLSAKLESGTDQQEAIALIARLQANGAWTGQKAKMGKLVEMLQDRLLQVSGYWTAALEKKEVYILQVRPRFICRHKSDSMC